jgi:hypothetical protein
MTVTPISGSPFSSVTVPVTFFVLWAPIVSGTASKSMAAHCLKPILKELFIIV